MRRQRFVVRRGVSPGVILLLLALVGGGAWYASRALGKDNATKSSPSPTASVAPQESRPAQPVGAPTPEQPKPRPSTPAKPRIEGTLDQVRAKVEPLAQSLLLLHQKEQDTSIAMAMFGAAQSAWSHLAELRRQIDRQDAFWDGLAREALAKDVLEMEALLARHGGGSATAAQAPADTPRPDVVLDAVTGESLGQDPFQHMESPGKPEAAFNSDGWTYWQRWQDAHGLTRQAWGAHVSAEHAHEVLSPVRRKEVREEYLAAARLAEHWRGKYYSATGKKPRPRSEAK